MNWASTVWSILSLAGAIVSTRGLLDIAEDRRAIGKRGGAYALLVSARRRREIVRLVGFVVYLVVGVESMLPIDFEGEGLLVILALFTGLLCLVLTAVLEQTDRTTMRRLFP